MYKAIELNRYTRECLLKQKVGNKWVSLGIYPRERIVRKLPGCIIN